MNLPVYLGLTSFIGISFIISLYMAIEISGMRHSSLTDPDSLGNNLSV